MKTMTKEQRFIQNLDVAITFHENNANDPYNIGVAVATALREVRASFVVAYDVNPKANNREGKR